MSQNPIMSEIDSILRYYNVSIRMGVPRPPKIGEEGKKEREGGGGLPNWEYPVGYVKISQNC